MKKILVPLSILCLLAILFIVTKPTKQACIDGIKEKIDTQISQSQNSDFAKATTRLVSDLLIDRYGTNLFRVDDCTFYQDIYINGVDQRIGVGILGFVIFTNQQAVQQEYNEQAKSKVANAVQNFTQDVKKGISNLAENTKKIFHKPPPPNLQGINEIVYKDSIAYIKAQEFHFGRLKSTREREINNALNQLQADRQKREKLMEQ
jgi:hypothetical protein